MLPQDVQTFAQYIVKRFIRKYKNRIIEWITECAGSEIDVDFDYFYANFKLNVDGTTLEDHLENDLDYLDYSIVQHIYNQLKQYFEFYMTVRE